MVFTFLKQLSRNVVPANGGRTTEADRENLVKKRRAA
jgi:hypothetical protein